MRLTHHYKIQNIPPVPDIQKRQMIPMQRFPLEKNRCEHRKDNQSDYFLNHFELHQ